LYLHEVVIDSDAVICGKLKCRLLYTYANEKFTNVFVRAFTKSDATERHFSKPSYRQENCHATVSLILCCLR